MELKAASWESQSCVQSMFMTNYDVACYGCAAFGAILAWLSEQLLIPVIFVYQYPKTPSHLHAHG